MRKLKREAQEKGVNFMIINPQKTKWCSLKTALQVSEWITEESQGNLANMLPQEPEMILDQMQKGWTRLAVLDGKIIGHITLWRYETLGWGELGSLIVSPLFRGHGIGKALCELLLQDFPHPFRVVSTTKTSRANHVLSVTGFRSLRFDELRKISNSAWQECCPCYSPPESCPKRDKECYISIH